jgi:hypothetical protein
MSPRNFMLRVIEPGLALVPGYMACDQSRVLLMAIAGQESNWSARAQSGDGGALGYWQFQQDGVAGVLDGVASGAVLRSIIATLDVPQTSVWSALQYNDPLACAVARLCLWNDPAALPAIGEIDGAWDYYVRNWRPGKPDRSRWDAAYATALSGLDWAA